MINVLICDDSALMRRSLKKIIESDRRLKVIGTARDGEDAVLKARELRPDVVTMDINMPLLDGISAMQHIVDEEIAPVLMVSSLTQEGAEATFESLALGAFDYIAKPGGTVSVNMEESAREIIAKIKAAADSKSVSKMRRSGRRKGASAVRTPRKSVAPRRRVRATADGMAVTIGISTGGPKTIFDVLPLIPADLPVPVFLVQHMPVGFTSSFAQRIDAASPMTCVEAAAGMHIEPGTIYLARAGRHLTLFRKSSGDIVIRTPARPEHQFMPSVNVMMESVLAAYGDGTVGVLMTGMGDDGADMMVKITEAGGQTIAESEETAIVFGMPNEAILRGGANVVAPSWDIAGEIIKAVA
ncbi:MAG TPA: chemotaxis-specific protein-glutamate methyltransferase CheB [Desulfobacterales bacterium]|nr:chemotaxis-specific protein-glutamate methyltransferase CheB [Desulfobacterales bacterium]